jgi:hypothetical protein
LTGTWEANIGGALFDAKGHRATARRKREGETLNPSGHKEQAMTLHRIVESWNEKITKLCNWTIKRLEGAADKDDGQDRVARVEGLDCQK